MTIAALFLATGWDFHAADVAAGVVLLLGVGVGIWDARVWYSIGQR
jgi:hypothetical protein